MNRKDLNKRREETCKRRMKNGKWTRRLEEECRRRLEGNGECEKKKRQLRGRK
jgi:hypothetical protein